MYEFKTILIVKRTYWTFEFAFEGLDLAFHFFSFLSLIPENKKVTESCICYRSVKLEFNKILIKLIIICSAPVLSIKKKVHNIFYYYSDDEKLKELTNLLINAWCNQPA